MLKKLKWNKVAVSVGLALMIGAAPVGAGPLQSQMDQIFNSMTNITAPGVYETQRRGVLTGGSVYVRNKIVDTQIASFAPPSWKSGCGGIDFFAGSFSFINADQFVQLLRSVASNAVGYAFQIALDNVCSVCSTYMNALQNKLQELNQYAGNSCQLAQGLVNDVWDGMDFKRKNSEINDASLIGVTEDFFAGFSESGGKDAASQVKNNPQTAEKLYGNLVWKELKNNQVAKWFVQSLGSDRPVNEMLMSITGTVIVDKPEESQSNVGGDGGSASKMHFVDPVLRFGQMIEGGEVKLWKCDSDDCMKPSSSTEKVKSLETQIYKMLMGGDGSVGIITKYSNPSGAVFTDKEKSLLAIMPDSAGALLRNLSANSQGGARELAEKLSKAIALRETYMLMNDLLNTVSASLGSSKMGEAKDMIKRLDKAREQLNDEYHFYSSTYPTMAEIIRDYYFLNQVVRKSDVMYRTSETARNF